MKNFWKDKNIFLTGASSGIGEALAEAIAARGGNLGLVARRGERLEKLAERCRKSDVSVQTFPLDVRDEQAMNSAAETFQNAAGPVDVVIANAGIGGNDDATRNLQPEAVKKVIDVNLLGAVNVIAPFLPRMKESKRGHLVAISSLAGTRGLPRSAAYSASKAAMNNFFESLRLDVAQFGIDVTIIKPGFIRTPLTAGRAAKMPFLMELEDAIPKCLNAIENQRKVASFPWQLAAIVKFGSLLTPGMYDLIAGRARFRE